MKNIQDIIKKSAKRYGLNYNENGIFPIIKKYEGESIMNNEYSQIVEILDTLDRKQALQLLGDILDKEYDLCTASNIVKEDCDSSLNKLLIEDMCYDEGDETGGFIKLRDILEAVEDIVNCDDYLSRSINLNHFVRRETEKESEENGHSDGVEWWTKDDRVDIDELYVGFES